MKKGYWLVQVDITDPEKFKSYVANTPAAMAKFGGKFLVRGGAFELVEGSARSRNTIIEFPSFQSAMDCWKSEEYQNAKNLRIGGAEMDIVVIEGHEE